MLKQTLNNTKILFIILALTCSGCSEKSSQKKQFESDSLTVNDLQVLVSTESELLGQPRSVISKSDNELAVYDHGYGKVIIFDTNGTEQFRFGRTGEGPGEWHSSAGARNLDFTDNLYFTTNESRFIFDLFDEAGNHVQAIPYNQKLRYNDKELLGDQKLLVSTDGDNNALAIVMDLNSNNSIVQRIGTPEVPFVEAREFEEERMSYANGELPQRTLNEALVAKSENGYLLFMNSLGELRHYSEEGDLTWKVELPSSYAEPIFDYVVWYNKEESRPHTVRPLRYADKMIYNDGNIYLFKRRLSMDERQHRTQVLTYNSSGDLLRQQVINDLENSSFLYDFTIIDQELYFIDIMNARMLRLNSM